MADRHATPRRAKPRLLSGPPALFRGKDRRRVITFTMTEDGHRALSRLMTLRDVSRADVLEGLIRDAAAKR